MKTKTFDIEPFNSNIFGEQVNEWIVENVKIGQKFSINIDCILREKVMQKIELTTREKHLEICKQINGL